MSAKFPPRPAKEPLTGKEAAESTLARFPRIVERLRDSGSPTTPSEKHLETARDIFEDPFFRPFRNDHCITEVARALSEVAEQYERKGMKRAAEVCEVRAAQWDANVDGRIPAFLSSYRQRRMADEARTIQRLILSEAGEE
jgi:hypothetical protein